MQLQGPKDINAWSANAWHERSCVDCEVSREGKALGVPEAVSLLVGLLRRPK